MKNDGIRLFAVCVIACTTVMVQHARQESIAAAWPFGSDAQVVWTPGAASSLMGRIERAAWKPSVNTERPRGGVELYAKVAPAVVVVRTETGHGTGWVMGPDGRVVTNYHVIADGLQHDNQRGASYAPVYLGDLQPDGTMRLRQESVRAYLLKHDPSVDLAVLKLDPLPKSAGPLSSLQLAPAAPKPGSAAVIVGHPASGMLWTLRSGQVASIGQMPGDIVDLVMTRLASTAAQRQQVEEELKRAPSRRIILTTAGANPGDSGGPVVDELGRVIAVTFAIPSDPGQRRFSYHVHLDEVRAFLADVPKMSAMLVPDAWDLGARVELKDANADGVPDLLVAGDEKPEMLLFDLDNDTPATARADLGILVRQRKWDFEFALRLVGTEPTSTAFYDTDNDGQVDLIHTVQDQDHSKNQTFSRLPTGGWRVDDNVKLTFASPAYMKDPRLAQRLRTLLERKK